MSDVVIDLQNHIDGEKARRALKEFFDAGGTPMSEFKRTLEMKGLSK